MMTLDEAIAHAESVAKEKDRLAEECECESHPTLSYRVDECRKCADEHRQLAEWLRELKKHTPRKPVVENIEYCTQYRCPVCGECVGFLRDKNRYGIQNFCDNCGQKIDWYWGDEDE